ncbi:MAG: DUF1360 domain-containing protein [Patescibacteria group bacterium]
MIRITDQYVWNVVFSIFFVILVVMGTIILDTEARIPFAELVLADYVLITLATWRLIRLFVYDAITKFLREQFYDVTKVGKELVLEKPARGPRRTLADLFSCPWCLGVWLAALVTFLYMISDVTMFLIVFLALSGIATYLQLLANLTGHGAERLKNLNEGR